MSQALRVVGLGLIVVAAAFVAASCGGSKKNPVAASGGGGGGPADLVIRIRPGAALADTNAYSPYRATIAANQTVSWTNDDAVTHTATSVSGGSFNTGNIAPGTTSPPIRFASPDTIHYHCAILGHNLNGILTVTP
jgi:hypothetical protein